MKKKSFLKSAAKAAGITLGVLCVLVIGLVLLVTHNFGDAYEDYDTTNTNISEYGKTLVSAHRSGGGIFPENTMMGALSNYISDSTVANFQPMGANFGIIPAYPQKIKDKQQRYTALAERSLAWFTKETEGE